LHGGNSNCCMCLLLFAHTIHTYPNIWKAQLAEMA
jgi:hypothetical protein